MKKEITSLYAGRIEISIGGIKIQPKQVSVKKSLTTVTDTFAFSVPMSNDNGKITYIPNVFGLPIDVYVNGEFYIGGILINRTLNGTDIECECSTHGWQLDNSDIYKETSYDGSNLGDFIKNVCNTNFFDEYDINITVHDFVETFSDESIENFFNKVYENNNSKDLEFEKKIFKYVKTDVVINSDKLEQLGYTRKKIFFAIYDPHDLYNTKIDIFTNNNEKMTSSCTQTVFDYIKSVTKNVNVFVKCIGLYDDLKDKLLPTKMYNIPKEIKDLHITKTYVLMLYRPGIEADVLNPLKKTETFIQTRNTVELTTPLSTKTGIMLRTGPYTKVNQYFTYAFLKQIGYVTNDGTENSNCISDVKEQYSGINEHSIYILRSKNDKSSLISSREIDEDIKKETIQKMSEKNQYVSKNRFDSVNQLGTIKNIFIEENLTEEGLKRRLSYEINAIKAESYKITATVVGYTMDMNFAKVNYWENTGNIFWDFNRKVIVNSPEQGINNLSLIVGEMEMCYDSSRGAYTNLTLIQPLSYSARELGLSDELIGRQKYADKYWEKLEDSKVKLFLYGFRRGIVDYSENLVNGLINVVTDTPNKKWLNYGEKMDNDFGLDYKSMKRYAGFDKKYNIERLTKNGKL